MDAINYRHRIEVLEEENTSLRARIAVLTGRNGVADIRRVFDVSEYQGRLFALLLARGEVPWNVMVDEVYGINKATSFSDADNSLRHVMKNLRRIVRPYGIDFKAVYKFGYRMPDECRSVARRLLKAKA